MTSRRERQTVSSAAQKEYRALTDLWVTRLCAESRILTQGHLGQGSRKGELKWQMRGKELCGSHKATAGLSALWGELQRVWPDF